MSEPTEPLEPSADGAAPAAADGAATAEPQQAAPETVAASAPPVTGAAADALAPEPFVPPTFAASPEPAVRAAAVNPETHLDLLDDVELDVTIELGRAEMYIEDVLRLGVGSVVELDRLAGDPVDIYVNQRLVARGEVLVLNQNFCVRVNGIVSSVDEGDVRP